MHVNVPPQASFSKLMALPLVLRLLKVSVEMLKHEQTCTCSGGLEQAQMLVRQMMGQLHFLVLKDFKNLHVFVNSLALPRGSVF